MLRLPCCPCCSCYAVQVPTPVELAAEDPPLPRFMGDGRFLNPAIRVGSTLDTIVDGELGAGAGMGAGRGEKGRLGQEGLHLCLQGARTRAGSVRLRFG